MQIFYEFNILKISQKIKFLGKLFVKTSGFIISKFLSYILFLNKLVIVIIREDRIGHQIGTLDCELYIAIERKNKNNINTIFVFIEPLENIANKHFRKITGGIVNSFDFNYYIFNVHSKKNLLSKFIKEYIPSNKRFYYSSETLSPRPKRSLLNEANTGDEILKKLNLKKEKYICIYSRDSYYLKERFKDINWDYHNYRNSDINNLRLLADYASRELNLEVVRVGSNPEKRLNWVRNKFPKIIDYSFSKNLNDKNDIDLITSCCFYLNNGGGPENIAIASRRKMIRINQIPLIEEIGYEFGIYIPKLLKRFSDKEYISIREAINLGISKSHDYRKYNQLGIYCEENDEIDVLNSFKDYLKLQKNEFNENEKLAIQKYRILRKENESKGLIKQECNNFIAPSFLLRYPRLLD